MGSRTNPAIPGAAALQATALTTSLATVVATSLGAVLLGAAPSRAGSVTADSVWDRGDARQRALQQVPKGATVTETRCQDLEIGVDNVRYRCTVRYEQTPPPAMSPLPVPTPAP